MFTSVGSFRGEVEQAGEEGRFANGGVKPGEGETEQFSTHSHIPDQVASRPSSLTCHTCARPLCLSMLMQRILIVAEHISIHLLDKQIIFEIDVVIVTGTSKLR